MLASKPRTQRIVDAARQYLTRNIMPEEAMVSIPVPIRRDGRLAAAMFGAITVPLLDLSNNWVYRPAVHIYADWAQERVLGHDVVREAVPFAQDQPVGLLYQPEFAGLPGEAREHQIWQALSDLYHLLDEVGPLYAEQRELTPSERELVTRLSRAYHRWVPPDIWPLYEALNPDFFRWLAAAG